MTAHLISFHVSHEGKHRPIRGYTLVALGLR
jgi:hypothetical protein